MLPDEDNDGQACDLSADISRIEFSKSFSEVTTSVAELNNHPFQPFDPIQEESMSPTDTVDRRIPCDFCGRKFAPDVSVKHVPIC